MDSQELQNYLKIVLENAIVMGNSPDRKGAHDYGQRLAKTATQFILKHYEPKKGA